MPKQCPKCGQSSESKAFINGFCGTCYFQKHPLINLKDRPEAKICPRCEAYWRSGRWIQRGETPVDEHLYNLACDLLDPLLDPSQPATCEVQVVTEPQSPITKTKELQAQISADAQDLPYNETQVVTIPIISTLCDICKRTAGGYFEATLQIRSSAGRLDTDQTDQIFAFLQQRLIELKLPSLSMKPSETRGGVDIKFLSSRLCRSLAKDLAEKFGLTLGVSSKVTGRTREGKTLRRENYALRFPPLKVGDVFTLEDRVYVVETLRNGRFIVINLDSDQRRPYSPKDLMQLEVQILNDQIQEFQVISETPEFYQLMNQQDYSVYDFPTPESPLAIGSKVRAIEWKNQLLLVPTQKRKSS